MKYLQRLQHVKKWVADCLASPLLLLILLTGVTAGGLVPPAQAARQTQPLLSSLWNQLPQNTLPFMYRPYYGSEQLTDRINSYFDHDKPWYAADNVFVRYDGKRWTGSDTSVLNCQPGSTCYDGHNGYDLRMRFEPVLSSASGKVVRAGWYNPQNHNDSFGLWVTVDHGNGFATVYGHLSALTVSVGDHISSQWQIGTTGTTGSSTGPHLHFGTYYYPSWQATDPSGWKGSYADPNTVPDHYLWISGTNDTPVPLLGGRGNQLAPGAILIDDGSSGWSHTGQWQKAKTSTDINGSLHWTSTTSGPATATVTWQAQVPANGYYEVGAFVDDNHASSGWAPYTIYSADPAHAGVTHKHVVEVDQEHIGNFQNSFGGVTTGAQWIGLGSYYFRSAQPGRVVLSNATGESGQQLASDGVEFAPLAPTTYSFTLIDDNTPAQMVTGSSAKVDLALKNTSTFAWPAQGQNAVQLLYRWLNSQGHVVSTSRPFPLARDLTLNATEPIEVNVQAPALAGTYTLQWDLIQGNQTFSSAGAQPKNDSVTVTSPTPNPGPGPTPTARPSPQIFWRRER